MKIIKKCFSSQNNYSFTNNLNFYNKIIQNDSSDGKIPMFRIMDTNGSLINNKYKDLLPDKETSIKMLKTMIKVNVLDEYFLAKQRNGDLNFYMTCEGEEALVTGSVAGLNFEDSIYPQYREQAAFLFRGFTTDQMVNQLTGNYLDLGKGRQMPVHYGSSKLNIQTVSSPVATQIPQAAGAGYLFKLRKEDKVCLTYFGEGTASEGDFHAGLNFASTLGSQTIFFCRNNKYAISTPSKEQFLGDGIVSRGPGYGMNSIRVDGNDALAVYVATKECRRICIEQKKPFLIEGMSFRQGSHSTSDKKDNYITSEVLAEYENYIKSLGNPIIRFENYCKSVGYIDNSFYESCKSEYLEEARKSLKKGLQIQKSSPKSMFDDVYDELPENLKEQYDQLRNHLDSHKDLYHLENYRKDDDKI